MNRCSVLENTVVSNPVHVKMPREISVRALYISCFSMLFSILKFSASRNSLDSTLAILQAATSEKETETEVSAEYFQT